MHVALVNTNRMQPPIAPIGLDYVAEALEASGHQVQLLDLCWEEDAAAAIDRFFRRTEFGLVGVTLRNTDDCGLPKAVSFLPDLARTVAAIRAQTDAPVVVGGIGFSVLPERILEITGADLGVWGEGEFAFPMLAARIERGEEWRSTPNLVRHDGDRFRRNPPVFPDPAGLPPMTRQWADNPRYFREGGQAGFETKRGCPGECVYCADPLAKGSRTRVRPPEALADELQRLVEMGIDHLHTCDAEFNLPPAHALAVCSEIERRGLGERLRWYAYCAPSPFSEELAGAMRRAGCVGINFGTDSGDAQMLRRLGRRHIPDDIVSATRWSKETGMAVMLDLLLGSPGESRESLTRTIELMKRAAPDVVGVSVGVGVYPGTRLATELGGDQQPREPWFHLEPAVAPFVYDLLDTLIGDDPRFLYFDPSRPERNYNYNANQRLAEAIRLGHRGAYWDILRRLG
ncbi:MAG: radical SAM protein [Bryobacteraceae bacterium]